jgi:hypothetical protein
MLPVVALLGDFGLPEFAAARELLQADAIATEVADVEGLLRDKDARADTELIVIAQARPRQWEGPWLDAIRRAWPLVRIAAVLGTWCEGETRTGEPLAADVRVFWYRFPMWWRRQMVLLANGRAAEWSNQGSHGSHGPLCENLAGLGEPGGGGMLLIAADDRESAESIAAACQYGGWASVWVRWPASLPVTRGATAIVYNGGRLDERELAVIGQLCGVYGPLPVVAIADFPTIDRAGAARAAGVTAALGKPYDVEDLLAAIRSECRMSNKEF